MEEKEDPHREKIHTAWACIASGPSLSGVEGCQGPCLVGNCTELKKKGIKTQQRNGWRGKDKQAAQSIVWPGQFQMLISDHCTIFL